MFKKIASHQLVEVTEAMGAGAFALTGVLAFFYGRQFLSNVLPLGKGKELTSGGTIALVSFFTGIEVAAGFVLLLYTFLQSTLTRGEES